MIHHTFPTQQHGLQLAAHAAPIDELPPRRRSLVLSAGVSRETRSQGP